MLTAMSTSPAASAPPATRRSRQRQATIAEIKERARRQLAEQGAGGVNLRAIAREMGTASSALYRYFASADELIGALLLDAYNAVADAVVSAVDARPPGDHAGRWFAVCAAYRRWSLDNPAQFALTHGTPLPGYQAPAEVTGPAASRTIEAALAVYASAVQAGAADPSRSQIPEDLETGPLWSSILADRASGYEPRLPAIILTAWASVLGYLVAEIFGSLTRLTGDTDRLYEAHTRTIMLGMGYNPALIPDMG
jgi:AcrR family transcriptional regulator